MMNKAQKELVSLLGAKMSGDDIGFCALDMNWLKGRRSLRRTRQDMEVCIHATWIATVESASRRKEARNGVNKVSEPKGEDLGWREKAPIGKGRKLAKEKAQGTQRVE
jgi:hypothetical protein